MDEKIDFKTMAMDEFKKEGLELTEEAIKMAMKAVLKIIPKMIIASENKYDDLLLAVLPVIEPKLMEVIDRINPEDNLEKKI